MEKYAKAQMEVIKFEAEDVITTSTVTIPICKNTDYDTITPEPGDNCIWGD